MDYYSADRGKDVPLTITTPKGGVPTWTKSPFLLTSDVLMNTGGESVAFRKMMAYDKA